MKSVRLIYIQLGYLLFLCLLWIAPMYAQTSERKALETKRAQILKEINAMNQLLSKQTTEKGSVLEQMELIDQKISMRQQLIQITNHESNLMNRRINTNIRKISRLREDLELLKKDYAERIVNAYQKRSDQSALLFLLSSDDFFQAFKRFQYLKQYTQFRKQQVKKIQATTADLTALNKDLVAQRQVKEALLAENKKVKDELTQEIAMQQQLLQTIRTNETKYTQAIRAKRKEASRIDQEIENLIKKAIAGSNKRAGKSGARTFSLTPEAKVLASSFTANKGKLIWPVKKGIKSQGFGVYADKIYPGIKRQNNGVTISTNRGEKARAVFNGEIVDVVTTRTGQKAVFVRHGNYISTYFNLADTYVEKGDPVTSGQELGSIYTNRTTGLTKLKFYLYRDTKRLNPEEWIYQL